MSDEPTDPRDLPRGLGADDGAYPSRPPRLYNPTVHARLVEAAGLGASTAIAAAYAGIAADTLSEWLRRGRAGDAALERLAREFDQAEAEWAIKDLRAIDGDSHWTSSAWRLERRYPEDYARRSVHDLRARDLTPESIARAAARVQAEIAGSVSPPPDEEGRP